MCKEGWYVRLGQEGLHEVGGTVWSTLKEDGTEKRWGKTNILRKRGEAGSRRGCLNKGELEPP